MSAIRLVLKDSNGSVCYQHDYDIIKNDGRREFKREIDNEILHILDPFNTDYDGHVIEIKRI